MASPSRSPMPPTSSSLAERLVAAVSTLPDRPGCGAAEDDPDQPAREGSAEDDRDPDQITGRGRIGIGEVGLGGSLDGAERSEQGEDQTDHDGHVASSMTGQHRPSLDCRSPASTGAR